MKSFTSYLQPALIILGFTLVAGGFTLAVYQMAEAWTPISGWIAGAIALGTQIVSLTAWIPNNLEIER